MRLAFLELPADERGVYLQQAALNRGLHPAIMEKDFWVCWLLGVLFGHPEFKDKLVFKGGTSLSKVFGVIQRFSEDIDLSMEPSFLGIAEGDVENAGSRTKRDHWMKRLEEACAKALQERIRPNLDRSVREVLGPRIGDGPWIELERDQASHSPILLFHYPAVQTEGFGYLRRVVKMEFGSLTDQRPIGSHPIKPWVAEEFSDTFNDWRCEVVSLEVERTFWEKATILHAEYHRGAEERMPERFSRHYADMAALAAHPRTRGALERHDLRVRVVEWKSRFFARSWARYDLARPGTFRLAPPPGRVEELQSDYAAMREMYMTEPMPFTEVTEILADVERSINGQMA